jgi:hypothetical protein
MPFPFDIDGTTEIGVDRSIDIQKMTEAITSSLKMKGGKNIKIEERNVTFNGLIGVKTTNLLQNIIWGKIILEVSETKIKVKYQIDIDRLPFKLYGGVASVGLILWMYNLMPFGFPAGVGFFFFDIIFIIFSADTLAVSLLD